MRENVHDKGRRYLLEGRLLVDHVDADTIRATCRGAGDVYRLGYDRGGWWCSCPARTTCSHLTALQLVTVRPGAQNRDQGGRGTTASRPS